VFDHEQIFVMGKKHSERLLKNCGLQEKMVLYISILFAHLKD